jgi:glycosyltransferase involved in cell wall biosynthesis
VATAGDGPSSSQVAINARAAARAEVGGVERVAQEMVRHLRLLRPARYRVIRPPARLAHRTGHAWEQAVLPLRAAGCALIYSPANLAPLVSRRNVVVIHDLAPLRHPEAFSRAYVEYQRRMLPALARRARRVITVSAYSKGELVAGLGLPEERIDVITLGVDDRFGAVAPTAVEAARARHGLELPYVLAVGTISARKNLGLLDPAAGALAERGIELVHAGSERGYLRASPPALRRLGYVADADLPGLYAGARALVMPSLYEGFGLPCLEAMAAGAPVVAARSGALPETVGEAGLFVDPDDAAGFTAAVLDAACDDALHAQLIERGRRRAQGFSWRRTAALTDAVIDRLLGEG